jgi:hypothetical protein
MNEHHRPDDQTARACRRIFDENGQCPSSEVLVAFHDDELPGSEATVVAAHLGTCPICAQLLARLAEADGPIPADDSYREEREEDRRLVAKSLGFRVGRPEPRPLLERFSRLWQTRVPAPVPAAVCAILLLVIFLPTGHESPVSVFGPPKEFSIIEFQTRSAKPLIEAAAGTPLVVEHLFTQTPVKPDTMATCEISGPSGIEDVTSTEVTMATKNGQTVPALKVSLTIDEPGSYRLRFSHPEEAFAPVSIAIDILAP